MQQLQVEQENSDFLAVQRLPKVELHAHLNGCIREKTLQELAKERKVSLNEHHYFTSRDGHHEERSMYNLRPRSLQDCFDIFAEIPKCVDDLASLRRITQEALEDFSQQHVAYLELRSTPKILLEETGDNALTTKQRYCETILECMQEFEEEEERRFDLEMGHHVSGMELPRIPMICKFIVAIDRSQSIEDAFENVELAHTLRRNSRFADRVIGMDLGGNPTRRHFHDFRPAFEKARECGMKITLHCAEIPCEDDDPSTAEAFTETKSILDFKPDRLGHSLLLPPVLQEKLLEQRTPVESCPTSNVMTLELAKHLSGSILDGLKTHPQLANWIEKDHPFSIGTDDPGIFHTNNTKELLLVQKAYRLSLKDIGKISLESMDHAFCSEATRKRIQE